MSYVSVAPSSPPIGALAKLTLSQPLVASPVAPITEVPVKIAPGTDFSRRRPAVQPPAAPPRAELPAPGDETLRPPETGAGGGTGGAGGGGTGAGGDGSMTKYLIGAAVLVGAILLLRR